jgi:hypothetical protein
MNEISSKRYRIFLDVQSQDHVLFCLFGDAKSNDVPDM